MTCPYCYQNVTYKQAARGDKTKCPHCKKEIVYAHPYYPKKKMPYWAKSR